MAQWKKGFLEAEGEFVWIAEADDLCGRKFLAEAMKGFRDEKVMISYTESKLINKWGVVIAPNFRWSRDREKTGHYKENYIKDGFREIEEIMAIRCTIPNVSAAVFQNEKKFLKYFDKALKFSQAGDWYFYAKILENGKIAYGRRALNKFRIHHDSKTGQAKKDEKHHEEILEMHEYFKEKYELSAETRARMDAEEARLKKRLGLEGTSSS